MTVQIFTGDCREVLQRLPKKSVHVCLTSPPYWGLRDFQIEPSVWGGKENCRHVWGAQRKRGGPKGSQGDSSQRKGRANVDAQSTQDASVGTFCRKCGAWRGQLGLEPTPQMFVEHMVEIFALVWDVLRDDGTLWLNLGDCYATGAGLGSAGALVETKPTGSRWAGRNDHNGRGTPKRADGKQFGRSNLGPVVQPNRMPLPGLKPKDLVGIPWRCAFALQDFGWYLRQDIIWSKPSPMPESVVDRCTKAHEYIFMFAKSGDPLFWTHEDGRRVDRQPAADFRWRDRANKVDGVELETAVEPAGWRDEKLPDGKTKRWVRYNLWTGHDYYYDGDAIAEPAATAIEVQWAGDQPGLHSGEAHKGQPTRRFKKGKAGNKVAKLADARQHPGGEHGSTAWGVPWEGLTRNKRSVWTVTSQPFPEAHFATFPPALIEPIILAATSQYGACAGCGGARARVTDIDHVKSPDHGEGSSSIVYRGRPGREDDMGDRPNVRRVVTTTGWTQCGCGSTEVVPCVVLDPFFGAGTTGLVADRLKRDCIGIDRNPEYVGMAERRIHGDSPLFAKVVA